MAIEAHSGPWGEEDLFALPESAQRYELLEGNLLVTPAPGVQHQLVSYELTRALRAAAPPGFTVVEAVGIRLPGGTLFIPDVVVASHPPAETRHARVLDAGVVALAVEIVSAGSRTTDRLTKPALYARAGIDNYWRVELEGGPLIVAYRREGDIYAEAATARPGAPLDAGQPFPVSFDPALLDQ